jgi:N-acyl-D-amino-acid deacylase
LDPATVIDRATFQQPELIATGIKRVFINGQEVWSGEKVTGNRPGKPLRHSVSGSESGR